MPQLKLTRGAPLDKVTNAFPYQLEAIDAVRELSYSAIFFEQGLGKTKIAIDLTLDWLAANAIDSVIVVTKKGLINNWLQEFAAHSHIKPRVLSSDRAANHRAFFSPARVYLANYEAISLEEDRVAVFARQRRLAIILDESQKIKNPSSSLAQSFFRLSMLFYKRLVMTGTPMANRPYDIWAQIFFLDGGASLGSDFADFKQKVDFSTNDKETYASELAKIFPAISGFCIRQTKEASGLELPGKVYTTHPAAWEIAQREMYQSVRTTLQVEVQREGRRTLDTADALLKRLLRLVQIASNPSVIDDGYCANPGKLQVLDELTENIIEGGEKVIVWTSFVENCRYLRRHLSHFGAVQINGSMDIADRNNSVTKFKNDPNTKVLVATPAAAKEGLTLTVANHVIFFDRSFSLDDYLQAQDRIHRISQSKTCYVHNIVLPDSIDEWVEALINLKSASARYGMQDAGKDELMSALETDLNRILNQVLGGKEENVEHKSN